MTTGATNNTTVIADLPDFASDTIDFKLLSSVAISGTEVFPGKIYTMTLDASGVGSLVIPTPDGTGDLAWLWEVNLPDGREENVSIAWSALSQDLATILAAAVSTTTPSDIAQLIINKVDRTGDTMTGNLTMDDASLVNPDTVQFNEAYSPTGTEPVASMFWNGDDEEMNFVADDDGTISIGKEVYEKMTNLSGVTVVNGDVVSTASATGNRQAFTLTDATDPAKAAACIGMVTVPSIGNNNSGRITKIGRVRGLNTSSYAEGAIVYVDPLNPGKLTDTEPTAGNYIIVVGTVTVSHANVGVISLAIRVTPKMAELSDVNGTALTISGQFFAWDQINGYLDATSNVSDFDPAGSAAAAQAAAVAQIPPDYIISKSGTTYYATSTNGGTDYSGTGTTVLQSAITALSSGGTIYNKTAISLSASLLIDGADGLRLSGGTVSVATNQPVFIIQNSINITIDNIEMYGTASGSSQTGISMTDACQSIRVTQCHIHNFGYDGIHALSDCTGTIIKNNIVHDCVDDGINPGGGVVVDGTNNTIVSGNVVYNITNDGIHISTSSENTIVSSNVIFSCGAGVGIADATKFTIDSNSISSCTYGILSKFGICRDFSINNNIIIDSTADGIQLTHDIENVTISNNQIYDSAVWGVEVLNCDFVSISGNIITGGTRGVYVTATNFRITGNTVRDATDYGIVASGTVANGPGVIANNDVDTTTTNAGIFVNCPNVIITSNILRNISAAEISLGAVAENCKVFANDVTGGTIAINASVTARNVTGNIGYVTESGGAAVIPSGTSAIIVTHDLKTTPTYVIASGSDLETSGVIVTTLTTTTLRISTATGANVTADRAVYWRAIYTP